MDLREDIAGEVTVLEVKGRIDSTTAPVLGEKLTVALAAPQRRLVLDLRQLEYISSAGFRVLLLAAKRAEEAEPVRVCPSRAVRSSSRSVGSSISSRYGVREKGSPRYIFAPT